MERIKITEDLSFSRIIHGFWRLADWDYTKEETLSLIEHDLEQGITTFDHADLYGSYKCEELFGEGFFFCIIPVCKSPKTMDDP